MAAHRNVMARTRYAPNDFYTLTSPPLRYGPHTLRTKWFQHSDQPTVTTKCQKNSRAGVTTKFCSFNKLNNRSSARAAWPALQLRTIPTFRQNTGFNFQFLFMSSNFIIFCIGYGSDWKSNSWVKVLETYIHLNMQLYIYRIWEHWTVIVKHPVLCY